MKLSEALRIGIKKRPIQGLFEYFSGPSKSCAVGTIMVGFGFERDVDFRTREEVDAIIDKIPALRKAVNGPFSLHTEIMIMNDDQRKTREEIADWLESIGE